MKVLFILFVLAFIFYAVDTGDKRRPPIIIPHIYERQGEMSPPIALIDSSSDDDQDLDLYAEEPGLDRKRENHMRNLYIRAEPAPKRLSWYERFTHWCSCRK